MFNKIKTYEVYINKKDDNPMESAVFVDDGFSFMAFIFHFLWAMFYKSWWLATAIFIYLAIIIVLDFHGIISQEAMIILRLGALIWVGFEATNIKASYMIKKGYILYDITSGKNKSEAQLRFFDRQLANQKNLN